MKFKHFAKLALALLAFGYFSTAHAQTNHPFSWKETSDAWFTPTAYAFQYATDEKAKVGHGPVSSDDCQETTNPGACTERMMKSKFTEVENPTGNFPSGYSGVEYVTFDVQSNGKINNYQVVKQPVVCKPCTQTAVNLVAALGDWHPAIHDGKSVKSTVVIPVYFDTKGTHN